MPEAHGAGTQGWADAGRGGPEGPLRPLIQIGSATARPNDAFAAVRYRGYWFAIDDHDLPSRLFTFLNFIFARGDQRQGRGPHRDDPGAVGPADQRSLTHAAYRPQLALGATRVQSRRDVEETLTIT